MTVTATGWAIPIDHRQSREVMSVTFVKNGRFGPRLFRFKPQKHIGSSTKTAYKVILVPHFRIRTFSTRQVSFAITLDNFAAALGASFSLWSSHLSALVPVNDRFHHALASRVTCVTSINLVSRISSAQWPIAQATRMTAIISNMCQRAVNSGA